MSNNQACGTTALTAHLHFLAGECRLAIESATCCIRLDLAVDIHIHLRVHLLFVIVVVFWLLENASNENIS